VLALQRGESVNAAWVIAATVAIQVIGYRFYSRFIAERVLGLDATRVTPAVRRNDGLDYVPTDRRVVFGHHFAAIAGAGPLVGPVLAAQMGYLPGLLWLLVGVLLAGAVQDFMVLFLSLRRDARSLGDMIRDEIGPGRGHDHSARHPRHHDDPAGGARAGGGEGAGDLALGHVHVAMTMPIALLMGVYLRYLRPGHVLEATVIGLVGLLLSIHYGGLVAAIQSGDRALPSRASSWRGC
jgi:carbon starvation protein